MEAQALSTCSFLLAQLSLVIKQRVKWAITTLHDKGCGGVQGAVLRACGSGIWETWRKSSNQRLDGRAGTTQGRKAKEHFRLNDQGDLPIPMGNQSNLTSASGKEAWQQMDGEVGKVKEARQKKKM